MDHYHRLNATISDLIMGNTYKFRVYSENKCGMSEDATVTKEEAKIVKTGVWFSNRWLHVRLLWSNKYVSVYLLHLLISVTNTGNDNT